MTNPDLKIPTIGTIWKEQKFLTQTHRTSIFPNPSISYLRKVTAISEHRIYTEPSENSSSIKKFTSSFMVQAKPCNHHGTLLELASHQYTLNSWYNSYEPYIA